MIIAIANQKGGVAKTTSTYNIAYALSKKKRVLMVDFDSQASLTISAGLEPLDIPYSVVDIMQKKALPTEQVIQKVSDNLDIITSIIDLATMEMNIISRINREKILNKALKQVEDKYDYILIDCPPQLSILTVNALSCSDYVLIPSKTDYLSHRGLTQLYDTIDDIIDNANPNLKIMGVIATLFDSRVKDDQTILEALKEEYNVIGVMKLLSAAKKGIYEGECVTQKLPSSPLAREYQKVASYIVSVVEGA